MSKGTRPTPVTHYFSGQGRVMLGDRNATTGKGSNFRGIGNCTALTFEVTSEKFEHTESMTGNRATDLVIPKEKKATMKFTCESLDLANLALGLFGEVIEVAGGTVTDEAIPYTVGGTIALANPGVKVTSVKTGAAVAGATAVDAAAYHVDTDFGTIYVLDEAKFTGANVYVTYKYAASERLDVFTKPLPEEKYLRFEGMNTVNDDVVLVKAPRVSFDPLPATALINEELSSVEFTANVLLDTTIVSGSQFFTQTVIKQSAIAAIV